MRVGLQFRQVHPKQNGQPAGTSDRWQLEVELRASQDRFRLVLENSPSPIGIFDQTGLMRYVSPTINDVLHYTTLVAGKRSLQGEICVLADLCAGAVRAHRRAADAKGQYLTFAIDPPELEIESDPQGMRQVLKELLGNAIKFTPAGGRIHLAVDRAGELAGGAPRSVRIVVSDTGIGMDAEQQAALFRPFVQGDQTLARRFEGLGLGLAFAYEMVTRLGGTITVDSVPGAGSRFTVLLPAQLPHN